VSVDQPKLSNFDLAATPAEKGVMPVLRADTAPAPPTHQIAAGGADMLFLDDGDNNADTFLGLVSDSTNIFYWTNVFSLPEFGFRLESFDFYMRTESAMNNNVYVEVGNENQTLMVSNFDLPTSPTGGWYRIPMPTPLIFNAGSRFFITVGASRAIDFPAGVDADASVPGRSIFYQNQNTPVNLNTVSGLEKGAFLIRAIGAKTGGRLVVNPAGGTITPGGSQTITVTFDAQGLAEGDYQGQLRITSNGGNRTVPVRVRVGRSGNVAELAYDNGTPTTSYNWRQAGQGSAVRFTPPGKPARLLQAKIFINSIVEGNQHHLRVLDASGAGGSPGRTISGPLAFTVPRAGWITYDLSHENISVDGDFYVMIEYNGTSKPFFGSEDTLPLEKRSWDFDGSEWTLFDTEDYLIRAAVEYATGVVGRDGDAGLPENFALSQNYPNPFLSEAASRLAGNPETTIKYQLPEQARVELSVYDLAGRQVAMLESGLKAAGQHLARWNGRNSAGAAVPSGVYFYRFEAASPDGTMTVLTKKMTVMR
jgi:hypothetical protein